MDFLNTSEVINTVLSEGALVHLIDKDTNNFCFRGTDLINIEKVLGKGVSGSVYLIKFKRNGSQGYYAMKVVNDNHRIRHIYLRKETTLGILIKRMIRQYKLPYSVDFVLDYNGYSLNDKNSLPSVTDIEKKQTLMLPSYENISPCKLNRPMYGFDKGDYVCEANIVETTISSFISYFVNLEVCPHFVNVLSFAQCYKSRSYTFMEIINGTLYSYIGAGRISSTEDFETCLFQILFALAVIQMKWGICHQDLHASNIFLKRSTEVVWKGKNLGEVDWWKYTIGKQEYYIPAQRYIIKIGDWGISAKYSKPAVALLSVAQKLYTGNYIPTTYSTVYDMLYFLAHCSFSSFVTSKGITRLSPKIVDKAILFMRYIIRPNGKPIRENQIGEYINIDAPTKGKEWQLYRPKIDKLENWTTPQKFIENIYKSYIIIPSQGTIASITDIDEIASITDIDEKELSPMDISE